MRRLFAFAFIAALAACARPPALHGTVYDPPKSAPRFVLADQRGAPYELGRAGQAAIIYFGFTHCADVCPQTLALLKKARERAGLQPAQLPIVFVSVDPKRDTPAAMRAFFAKVGVQATGLTGTLAQLRPVYRAYGVAVQPAKDDVGHTDFLYLIDAGGRLREILTPDMPLKDIAADLKAIVD